MPNLRISPPLALLFSVFGLLAGAPQQQAVAQLVNPFGNLVLPKINLSDVRGLSNQTDGGGTAGNPEDNITLDQGLDILAAVRLLIEDVEDVRRLDNGERRDEVLMGLRDLRDQLEGKASSVLGSGPGFPLGDVGGEILLNAPGAGIISQAVAGLPTVEFITNDAVQAAISVIANTDPYVSIGGTITNSSTTDSLNAFIPFEEAFLESIALDAVVLRQSFVSFSLEDTNGDGTAFLQDGQIAFQVLATEDVDDPTFFNTDPIGTSEAFGVSRLRAGDSQERFRDTAEVNRSRIDRVDPGAMISHLTGEFRIQGLSPGDSVTFTAVVSLGIEGDPLTPLISADSIATIFAAGQFLEAAQGTVPEPATASMAMFGLAALARCRGQRS